MKVRNYDSTVARIAGNIASGLVAQWGDRHLEATAQIAVELARTIIAEVQRTEPLPGPDPSP